MAKIAIYKRGQGKYTRGLTFLGVMVMAVIGAGTLSAKLAGYDATQEPFIQYGIPAVVVIAIALVMFWVVNWIRTADFLIATESEMKKVSWSSKKEIIGSTKVVIVFTFILATILFCVDILFAGLFRWLKIMG